MTNPQSAPIIMLATAAEQVGAACRRLLDAQQALQAVSASKDVGDVAILVMKAGVTAKEWEVRYLSNKLEQLLQSIKDPE